MIISYIRKEDGSPRGCFVSDGRDRIGMSFCHKDDQFTKNTARGIAGGTIVNAQECLDILMDRVEDYQGKNPAILDEDVVRLLLFWRRINRYYKEGN